MKDLQAIVQRHQAQKLRLKEEAGPTPGPDATERNNTMVTTTEIHVFEAFGWWSKRDGSISYGTSTVEDSDPGNNIVRVLIDPGAATRDVRRLLTEIADAYDENRGELFTEDKDGRLVPTNRPHPAWGITEY